MKESSTSAAPLLNLPDFVAATASPIHRLYGQDKETETFCNRRLCCMDGVHGPFTNTEEDLGFMKVLSLHLLVWVRAVSYAAIR
ncbi:CBM_HP2_G0028570.mRNA.1.CDS.1 [Saccharomyces cerevisiae]|nr:CBM_HP2_G0028570.mRNA.1.CDS.1 [Saccharomyces cerevisiae]CAI6634053.1 CBM_HP2_G0028570.mRNA.1.CDS.1 [Saccharomyces cerevisiae]